jgi:hypothetical protein
MEERVQTSFIPKASLEVERKQVRPSGQVALANVIAGVILILAILGAAGMFAFQQLTTKAISDKQASLERSRGAFEPATIKELSRLNKRIESGGMLFTNHVALSNLFNELEKLTLSSVRFADFSFEHTAQGRVVISAKGEAASFNAVALQSGDFSKSAIITDPIFSNVNISRTGTIDFDFSAVIDPSRIRYTGAASAASLPSDAGTPPATNAQ